MPAAAEEQRDPMAFAQGHHAGGVQAAASVGIGVDVEPASFPHQFEDLDGRVIVVQDVPLRRLPDQFVMGRGKEGRHRLHDVPLGRGRQRDAQVPLQAIESVKRQAAPVLQEADHAAGRGVVFRRAGRRGLSSGEDLAT